MRLSALRSFTDRSASRVRGLARRSAARVGGLLRRKWVKITLGSAALVAVVMTTAWTGRHAWAIYRLNRGVGDTMFLDGYGREWFRLNEQRRDVPLSQISNYLKDAVIAVEDHRYYHHPGIDPIGLSRAAFSNLPRTALKAEARLRSSLRARCSFRTPRRTAARSKRLPWR